MKLCALPQLHGVGQRPLRHEFPIAVVAVAPQAKRAVALVFDAHDGRDFTSGPRDRAASTAAAKTRDGQ